MFHLCDESEYEDLNIPEDLFCPIGMVLMSEPVLGSDGYLYNKKEFNTWINKKKTSPCTNLPLIKINSARNKKNYDTESEEEDSDEEEYHHQRRIMKNNKVVDYTNIYYVPCKESKKVLNTYWAKYMNRHINNYWKKSQIDVVLNKHNEYGDCDDMLYFRKYNQCCLSCKFKKNLVMIHTGKIKVTFCKSCATVIMPIIDYYEIKTLTELLLRIKSNDINYVLNNTGNVRNVIKYNDEFIHDNDLIKSMIISDEDFNRLVIELVKLINDIGYCDADEVMEYIIYEFNFNGSMYLKTSQAKCIIDVLRFKNDNDNFSKKEQDCIIDFFSIMVLDKWNINEQHGFIAKNIDRHRYVNLLKYSLWNDDKFAKISLIHNMIVKSSNYDNSAHYESYPKELKKQLCKNMSYVVDK